MPGGVQLLTCEIIVFGARTMMNPFGRRLSAGLLENMRPACPTAHFAAIAEFTGDRRAGAIAPRAFAGRLSHQNAALAPAHQTDIMITAKFPRTFAPGAGFWRILNDRHDHRGDFSFPPDKGKPFERLLQLYNRSSGDESSRLRQIGYWAFSHASPTPHAADLIRATSARAWVIPYTTFAALTARSRAFIGFLRKEPPF